MLLQLQNVSGGYGKGDIVKNVSCEADEGDILCLAGPNGCGKTTLFRLIMGSIPLSGGRILIDGQDHLKLSPRELANRIAYIPQYHSPVFSYTVLDVVLMGRASHFSAFDSPKAVDRDAAFEALYKVNALELANKKYTSLSGGQRQLALIARAICQNPCDGRTLCQLGLRQPAAPYGCDQGSCFQGLLYHYVYTQSRTSRLCRYQGAYDEERLCGRFRLSRRGNYSRKSSGRLWH